MRVSKERMKAADYPEAGEEVVVRSRNRYPNILKRKKQHPVPAYMGPSLERWWSPDSDLSLWLPALNPSTERNVGTALGFSIPPSSPLACA